MKRRPVHSRRASRAWRPSHPQPQRSDRPGRPAVNGLPAGHRKRSSAPVADQPATPGATPLYAHHLERNQPLPQLDLVRDPVRMRCVWENLMPQHRIEDCSVVLVRYSPAKNKSCLVCYRLTIGQRQGAASQILSARFYPPGESLSYYLEAQLAPLAAPAFGQPLYHLPELEGVVWAFPNDRKVPGIPALLDRQRLATDVVPRLVRVLGVEAAVEEVSPEFVQYVPEHGCPVRVTVLLDDGRRFVFYGKAYYGAKGEETYRNMCALRQAPQRPVALGMAQPVAYEPDHRILWQSAVEGATLAELEKIPGPRRVSVCGVVGEAVAILHSIPLAGLKPETASDVCTRLQAAAERLGHAQPRLARRVSALTARLLAGAGRLDTPRTATLHGGLHAKNVISTGAGVALIDLDGLHTGDPLQDLGSLLASLFRHGLEHEVSAADVAQMARAVLHGYEISAAWELPRLALRWYTATALLSEAERRVKRTEGPSLEALLDGAEGALSGAGLWESVLPSPDCSSHARLRQHNPGRRHGATRCAPQGAHTSRREASR